MITRALYDTGGELSAFIPEFNSEPAAVIPTDGDRPLTAATRPSAPLSPSAWAAGDAVEFVKRWDARHV